MKQLAGHINSSHKKEPKKNKDAEIIKRIKINDYEKNMHNFFNWLFYKYFLYFIKRNSNNILIKNNF